MDSKLKNTMNGYNHKRSEISRNWSQKVRQNRKLKAKQKLQELIGAMYFRPTTTS